MPISLIMQEVFVIPAIYQYFQEQAHNLEMSGSLEAAVGSVDAAGDNPKFPARKFFGEEIVLSIEGTLMEAAQLIKSTLIEQHEHSGAERLYQHGTVLGKIVPDV